MANIIRSPKSGSDWTKNELLAYNISIKEVEIKEFFGIDSFPKLEENLLDPSSVEGDRVLAYLDLASRSDQGQESAVDDFARELLRILGYEKKGTILRTRFSIPFEISGDDRKMAQTDVCLVDRDRLLLLLIQGDKTYISSKNPEPQLIAESIAAFQFNNERRYDYLNKSELNQMTIPCITMKGTFPTFYLVPVTQELNTSIVTAQYPENKTIVLRYTPRIEGRRRSDGMVPPDNREEILKCYMSFKKVAENLYKEF